MPNNAITRFLIPSFAGKAMNNLVLHSFITFFFEDLPQIVIGIIYIILSSEESKKKKLNTVILSLVISIINLFLAIKSVLSIRPSVISQLDFNELSGQKKSNYKSISEKYMI